MFRILLNPDPGAVGGAPAGSPSLAATYGNPAGPATININVPTGNTAGTATQGAGQGGQPAKPMTPIDVETLNSLYQTARDFEAFKASQAAAVEQAKADKLAAEAQKAGLEKQFNDYRDSTTTKLTTIQNSWLAAETGRTVAAALAGVKFVSDDAAKQAQIILAASIEAVMGENNVPVIRDKATGRPAADVLRESIASPAFAHFLAAEHRGGAGAPTGAAGTTGVQSPADIANLSGIQKDLAVIAAHRDSQNPVASVIPGYQPVRRIG